MNSSSKKQLSWNITEQLNQKELEQLIISEEENVEDTLWEKRPIRLLNLKGKISWQKFKDSELYDKEYNRITSSLKANYYNKEDLIKRFSKDKDLLKLLEESQIQKISNGVFFPIVNEKKESYLPISSITSFCKISEKKYDFKRNIILNQNKLNNILDFENKFFPEIIQYEEIKGDSFEVAWFVKEWLDFYNSTFQEKKSIFCTGSIDNEGNICKIDNPNEKLETASYFDFDYIVFPEENRIDLKSWKATNVFFFKNINQLKSWLLEMSENLSNLNKIPRWLSSSIKDPTCEDFTEYFNNSITGNPINNWKQKIQSSNLKQKLDKLKIIIKEYAKYICKVPKLRIYKHYPSFLPLDYFYFSLLDYFSCINDNPNAKNTDREFILKELEKLYYSLFYKLLSNDNNLNIASLRLQSLKQEQNDIYSFLLKKYPAIIGLFFNHPTDYLLLIASLTKENQLKHKNLINIIINKLEEYHKKNIKLEKLEAIILKAIISNYSNEISEIKPAIKKTSEQMASLAKAKSLAIKKQSNNIIKACNMYFEIIVNNLDQQIYSNYLIESFDLISNSKLLEKWLKQNHQITDNMKSDGFSTYLQELKNIINKLDESNINKKKEESYKDIINKSFKCSKEFIKCLISDKIINENKTTDFYPQPALHIFLRIKNNIGKNHLIIKEFSKNNKDNNSSKLKAYCLSFWSGCLAAKFNYTFSYNNEDEYKISFILGYLSITNNNEIHEYLKKEINKLLSNINDINCLSLLQLIWLKFIGSEIMPNSNIKEIITSINFYFKNTKKDNTIATFIKKLLFTSEKENNILNNPKRSIQQLLYQLIKLLIDNEYDNFNLDECGLNNSQFITEFLRIFCIQNSNTESLLFIPIHWRSSIDKQMFNTIAISYFYTNKNKYLLQSYLFSIVDDLPNLLLGFHLLDNI